MIDRRRALIGGALLAASSRAARAEWSPSRPVTIIVPYPAGGGTDVLARIVARDLSASLRGNAVVENAPGASGAIGSRRVAKADPDGHTLLVTTNQTHATNISLMKDGGGYHPIDDFTVLGQLADLQHLLVVRADLAAKSAADVVALAKSSTKLTCGSTGIGSASHLTMELFKAKTSLDLVHVPYRGAAPLLQDLVGGRIDMAFATVPTVLGQVQGNQVRALAVASPAPCPQLPGLPTLAGEGIAGVEADAWIAAFGPAKLPPEITRRYASALRAMIAQADIADNIRTLGMLPNWREPTAFAAFQRQDIDRWAAIIRAASVAAE
ncbi:Bug family tripartite tricarboxylate transporter substrate binding protein [Enterovirga rhinocerotis]|uniref:Tripartite-type tricarboxylate transporter receptor subunit TctC n=1 Tax=Enterovirga rhinocerotis TaxID=1339210 RepID=A0A4R7BNQ1_9HYPH|nr:tripartite tricarboxylate transporter substrate binding protein [Enterovirga rhinocerotis]TDR87128.1 tripartite-type tricarboxylate transporter receptor subunit TctC [Enterovirga rhinocerotis]